MLKSIIYQSIVLLGIIALWQVLAIMHIFPPVLFPSPYDVLKKGIELLGNGKLEINTAYTLYRLMEGFIIGAVVGILLGAFMAAGKIGEYILLTPLSFLMPIPSVAWVPFFLLWFGLGSKTIIILVVFTAILPIAFNTWSGLKTVDRAYLRAGQAFGAKGISLFFNVTLPASLPFLLTGLRLGFSRAWRAVVAGEMLAATSYGLGYIIYSAREFLSTDVMAVALIIIGIIGIVTEKIIFAKIEDITVRRWGMIT